MEPEETEEINIPTEIGIPTLFHVSQGEIQEEIADLQTHFGMDIDNDNMENDIWG